MKRLPTDLQILDEIYEQYYKSFSSFSKDNKNRDTKIYIPIDITMIANNLKVDVDIVFGRLYYHLEKKHGYKQDDGASVHLFSLMVGNDRHCVNFPLLASVLANLRNENRKYLTATRLAIVSLLISIISFILTIFIK